MIYDVSSKAFQRFLEPYTFTYYYSEIVGNWSCQASTPLHQVLFDERFRVAREALFSRHNLPDSVLTIPDVHDTLLQKPAAAALCGRRIVFIPLASVNKAHLLYGMAGRYIDLYKSSSELPGRLAQQIEGPSSSGNPSPNPNPSISATLQTMLETLQASVRTLQLENAASKAEMQECVTKAEMQECVQVLESANESLQQEVDTLQQKVGTLQQDLTGATRKLRMLGAMENVLVRKLLEQCRNKCKQELTAAKILFPVNDWNEVIDDPSCLTLLTSFGLRREFGLQATQYGPKSHMKQKGDKAAHEITEDRMLYAELVCSKEGFERESLVEIYKFVFPNSDPELEVFTTA